MIRQVKTADEQPSEPDKIDVPADHDDPEKVEGLLSDVSEPPAADELPEVEPPEPDAVDVPVFRRLISGAWSVAVGDHVQRLTTADAPRKELHLTAQSDTAGDYILYASDSPSLINADQSAARLYAGESIVLSDYVGPIYVVVPESGVTGPVVVSYVGVTR